MSTASCGWIAITAITSGWVSATSIATRDDSTS